MRIVVLGAGAMGCLFGGLLFRAGHEVTLVDVSAAQIEAVNRDGLALQRDGEALVVPVPAAFAAGVTMAPEVVILFTKTLHSEAALESIRHLIAPETVLLSLQNGLGNDDVMARYVPRDRIVQGVTTFPADLVAPGRVHSVGSGHTRIMSLEGGVTPRLEALRDTLRDAGLECEISPDVAVAIWEKVAFNCALNALTAVTGLRIGAIADSPEATRLAHLVAREVTGVAQRKGIGARTDVVLATIAGALAEHREHQPSMLQDVAAGRRTEVDSLNGAVVREAAALGVAVPFTEALYLLVRTVESAAAGGPGDAPVGPSVGPSGGARGGVSEALPGDAGVGAQS